jgi:hypothetical protein
MTKRPPFDVLVGCEFSATVRDAFIAVGRKAVSCDLIPSTSPGPHIQCDIMQVIRRGGNMAILHPDCTRMALCGNRWWAGTPERAAAWEWTEDLWNQTKGRFHRCMLEQPMSTLSTVLGPPTQKIHPHEHGHGETKETWLWLHNLPALKPSNLVSGREQRIWKMGPCADRGRQRSIFYAGVAKAMADQWGDLR